MRRTWVRSASRPCLAVGLSCVGLLGSAPPGAAQTSLVVQARFTSDADGFTYADDVFRNTGQPNYASGTRIASGGFSGGAIRVNVGGVNTTTIQNMSGGWRRNFTTTASANVIVSFRFKLTQTAEYESDELSQLLVSVDGILRGYSPKDYAAQVVGNGNGGSSITTGWRLFHVNIGSLAAGGHSLVVGGFNNKKTYNNESTEIVIDDVLIAESADPAAGAEVAVAALDFVRFKQSIQTLSGFGDRTQGTQSNVNAGNWIQQRLESFGYGVVRHAYTYNGQARQNIYATKVGTVFPDRMYIVSAHFDGRGGGGGADDDGSGVALVLETAFALAQLETDASVRFILWNNEETGLNGSAAYAQSRSSLQGVENPAGSGLYPEPSWLGVIQHDMILFDHGRPPQASQIAAADVDIEYQTSSTLADPSLTLANSLRSGNGRHSVRYPSQVGSNMRNTDSYSFRNLTASVSVRENQRIAEIGNGANPHWHQPTDLYGTYSELDFELGFDAVRMTVGTVAELAGAQLGSN